MNHTKTRKQRQQRRAGRVRRFEFVLQMVDGGRDQAISQYLDSLPEGQRGEFVRQALYNAMLDAQQPLSPARKSEREKQPAAEQTALDQQLELPEPAQPTGNDTSASQQFEMILKEIAALREAVQRTKVGTNQGQSRGKVGVKSGQESPPSDDPTPMASRGLDTNAPRRKIKREPEVTAVPDTITAEQEQAARDRLLATIKAFGTNQ